MSNTNDSLPKADPRAQHQKTVFMGDFDDDLKVFFDSFAPMDKDTMGGRCVFETKRMTTFMQDEFQFENIQGETFADGVRAFKLGKPIENTEEGTVFHFQNEEQLYEGDRVRVQNHGEGVVNKRHPGGVVGVKLDSGKEFPRISRWALTILERVPRTDEQADVPKFSISREEILSWQSSFRAYFDENFIREHLVSKENYDYEDCQSYIMELLSGKSPNGKPAWAAKFVARISQAPIFCLFDSKIIRRKPSPDDWAHNIYCVSQPGVDFAGRNHDDEDIYRYVQNWKTLYTLDDEGKLAYPNGRDFIPNKHDVAILNESILRSDLERSTYVRLRACDEIGIQFVCETAIGCGVFAGDFIGIGAKVRHLVASSIRSVLEKETFKNIQCVIFALPIFGMIEHSNYKQFIDAFDGYSGQIPICFMDNSAHQIAYECAKRGYKASELNPADSHCVFGEYWQNMGPGTEEKFALTTAGLLTQHHAINSKFVLNEKSFVPIETKSKRFFEKSSM